MAMASQRGGQKLTSEQKQDIQAVFRQFDEDRDGYIYFDELGDVLRVLGQNPTEMEIADMTKRHSSGTNENLDLDAVYVILEDVGLKSQQEANEEMLQAFRQIDKSGDGHISKRELRNFLSKHEQEVVREDMFDALLLAADVNQDGKLDYAEFVKFLTSQPQPPVIMK